MNSVIFAVVALVFMYIGRKIGWALSRAILYPSHVGVSAWLCIGWGIGVAYAIHALIAWQHPNIIVKIIFGLLLGAYVAVPNYGLVAESSIPPHAMPKHNMIFTLPVFIYIASSIAFAWLT
jgi:hypothetical protein